MIKFRHAGDSAVLVELGTEISPTLSRRVYRLFREVDAARPPGYIIGIPAFTTLLVEFDPMQTDFFRIQHALAELIETDNAKESAVAGIWRIPVCYDVSLAPDLERAAQSAGLSIQDYAQHHSRQAYTVYMLGGFPGYPYMGDVPQHLELPRLSTPRLRVEPGSVAIAGSLTAIYPAATPGGWNLVGMTPVPIFNLERDPPALISPGDCVQFVPIALEEFENARASIAGHTFDLSRLRSAPA